MAKVVFEETQRFDQWWIRGIFILIMLVMLRMLIRIIDAGPLNKQGMLIIVLGIVPILITTFLLFGTRLKSRIDEIGIEAVFLPFSFSRRKFKWNEIKTVEVVDYNPLKDFGGWGYKISLKGNTAMNVKGKVGIKIFLENGKQFLIGTQRPDEARKVIDSYSSMLKG